MRKKGIAIVVSITALVAVFILYVERSALYATLDSLHLIPHEEPLTELYFESPLPTLRTIGADDRTSFSFTIHNLEGRGMNYEYHVYAVTTNGTTTIERGSVSVRALEYVTRKESILFVKATPQAEIFVELLPPINEMIHFKLIRTGT